MTGQPRTLFDLIEAWKNAPSNTASARSSADPEEAIYGVGVSEEWLRTHQERPRYLGSRIRNTDGLLIEGDE